LYNIHLQNTDREFNEFFTGLDTILDLLYSTKIEAVVCGDTNTFVDSCEKKTTINTLLATYNLSKVFYNSIED